MKIYNEVVTQFNDLTGQWDTTYEDSEEYNGPMAFMQGGIPPNATPINTSDTIADTRKTTAGYFDGDGTISGNEIFMVTGSIKPDKYYFNISDKTPSDPISKTQFSLTFGHVLGGGSNTYGDSLTNADNIVGETKAIYKQLSHTFLGQNEATGGFFISSSKLSTDLSPEQDEYIYALIGKRENFKDRINKKAWTLILSGSNDIVGVFGTAQTHTMTITVATAGTAAFTIIKEGVTKVFQLTFTTNPAGTAGEFRGNSTQTDLAAGIDLSVGGSGADIIFTDLDPGVGFTAPVALTSVTDDIAATFANEANVSAMDDLSLTDDSNYIPAVATPGGPRHNIVAGALGVYDGGSLNGYLDDCYGWFYPEMGAMIFSGKMLASKIAGVTGGSDITASCTYTDGGVLTVDDGLQFSSSGFTPNLDRTGNAQNAARFARCMKNVANGNTLRLRSEEDQTQENYFCRIRAEQYNFSANPTFTSGSKNKIRNKDMHGDPQSFITGVGLYNSAGQLLAIAKLSKPLLKNFASEATIKIKLTY